MYVTRSPPPPFHSFSLIPSRFHSLSQSLSLGVLVVSLSCLKYSLSNSLTLPPPRDGSLLLFLALTPCLSLTRCISLTCCLSRSLSFSLPHSLSRSQLVVAPVSLSLTLSLALLSRDGSLSPFLVHTRISISLALSLVVSLRGCLSHWLSLSHLLCSLAPPPSYTYSYSSLVSFFSVPAVGML